MSLASKKSSSVVSSSVVSYSSTSGGGGLSSSSAASNYATDYIGHKNYAKLSSKSKQLIRRSYDMGDSAVGMKHLFQVGINLHGIFIIFNCMNWLYFKMY